MSGQEYLVSVNVPPILEEAVVDCLLAIDAVDSFSSQVVYAHSSEHNALSLAEQVAGRQKQVRFQMYVPEQQLSVLLQQLREHFSGSGMRYWVVPVLESGTI